MTDPKKPTDLNDEALDQTAGGFEAWPSKWKGPSFDGKGNDATTEGGFSDVSGLSTEVQYAEYRDGDEIIKR